MNAQDMCEDIDRIAYKLKVHAEDIERQTNRLTEERERQALSIANASNELAERERKVSNRENALSQIMETAANRKAEIETLKQANESMNKRRLDAEAKAKAAEAEKRRLEDTVAQLLREKRELEAKIGTEVSHGS